MFEFHKVSLSSARVRRVIERWSAVVADAVQRLHCSIDDELVTARHFSLVFIGSSFIRRINAVIDHLLQEVSARLAIASQQAFHIELHDSRFAGLCV